MPLTEDEKKTLEDLQRKAEEPEPAGPTGSRNEHINLTIDLDNPDQVKRAVRAGYLPASYLEEDEAEEEDEGEPDSEPRRRLRGDYT
jgi:hypothetical protein